MYKIIRPPKFGNCSASEGAAITLEDYKNCFDESKNDSHRKSHISRLKIKIQHLIETETWEAQDLIEIDESVEFSSDMLDLIIYCNCGYICRKMLKKLTCQNCRKAFMSQKENSIFPLAEHINSKNKGSLIYANFNLYKMLRNVETAFIKHMKDPEVYYKVLEDISNDNINLSFPCNIHKCDVIPELLHDYILMRMLQYSRLIRKESKKLSLDLKKESRVKKS